MNMRHEGIKQCSYYTNCATMYQNRSDALEILTDHAEIQASIFRGAIAEKKELKDIPFFCHARGGSVCVLARLIQLPSSADTR